MKELGKAFAFLTILALIGSFLANSTDAQTLSSPKIGIHQISTKTVVDSSSLTAPLSISPTIPGFDSPTHPKLDYRRSTNPRTILESQSRIPSSVFGINSNPSNRVYGDKFGSFPGQGAYQPATKSIDKAPSSTIIEPWNGPTSSTRFFGTRLRHRIQSRPFRGLFRR